MFINQIAVKTRAPWAYDAYQKRANETWMVILFYSLIDNYIYEAYHSKHIKREIVYNLETSVKLGNCPGHNKREYLGITPKTRWGFGDEKMTQYIKEGKIYKQGNKLKFKNTRYGFIETDLWEYASSKQGYPTAKPHKLLKRVIQLSTV